MYTLLNNTASDFANAASVDRIGFVPPADPMNTVAAAEAVVLAVEAAEVVGDVFFVAEETADIAVAAEYVEATTAGEEAVAEEEAVAAEDAAVNDFVAYMQELAEAVNYNVVGMDADLDG